MEEFVKKLIDRLKEHHNEVRDMYLKGQGNFALLDGKMRGIEDANAIIVHLAKEHNGGWIPCSERLPEEDGVYIISFKEYSGLICCAVAYLTLNHPKWKWWDLENEYEYYEAVIAWQPLPAPYKEEE